MKNSIYLFLFLSTFFVNTSNAQTLPYPITSLGISNLNATSVRLNWNYNDFTSANTLAPAGFSISWIIGSNGLFTDNILSSSFTFNSGPFYVSTTLNPTNLPRTDYVDISGLQPNTTYTFFPLPSDGDGNLILPFAQEVRSNGNIGEFLGFRLSLGSCLAITFTTKNIDGSGGTSGIVSTLSAQTSTTNQAPTANAGPDQTITLPTNSVALSGSGTDTDGTIVSYAWSVVSGPNTPTFSNASSAATSVSNLVQGTYSLQLRVTDNLGATTTDLVVVNVNPAVVVTCTNDNFEPNNTSASASAISVGSSILAKICPLTDVDFYRFNNSSKSRNIRVTLSNLPTNYVVELYAPNGSLVRSNTSAGTANKVIVFNTSTVGTYRVRVLAGSGAVANNSNYTLRVETSRNTFAAALRLANPSIKEVEIVSSNNDITLYPNPTENFLNFESIENKIVKCIIYNQKGIQVGEKSSKDGLTNYDMSALDKGIYTIQLENSNGEIVTKKVIKK